MNLAFVLLGILLATLSPAKTSALDRYVSMGSSYAAGPGAGVPDPLSGACARSMSNYARQVAQREHLNLVDVSCSGATTDNILVHGQHGFPAQIEAVTTSTALVSILIGGNDIGYVGNLGGLSCRDTGGTACQVLDDSTVERRLAVLPGALDRVVSEVRRRAPDAHVVLVGYLPAVPASGDAGCPGLPLSPSDLLRMRAMSVRLAQVIGAAAHRNGTGIVRSSLIGTGHDVCSGVPFVAGVQPPRSAGWPSPVPYHPNQAGMNRIAAALVTATESGATGF